MKNVKKDNKKQNNKLLIAEIALVFALLAVIAAIVIVSVNRSSDGDVTSSQDTSADEDNTISGPSVAEGLEYDYGDFSKYIKICDISTIVPEYDKQIATQEQVDLTIKELLAQAGTSVAVTDRTAQKGDTVVFGGSGIFVDNETKFQINNDTSIVIGENNGFPDGFEDNFIGHAASENFTFTFTYPVNYSHSNFAGKQVSYNVTISEIKVVSPAEYDKAFIASQNIDGVSTKDEFRAYIEDKIEEALAQQNEQSAQNAILKALIAGSEVIEYPEKELQYYRDYADRSCKTYATAMGMTENDYKINNYGSVEAYEQDREDTAKESVKKDLIIHSLAKEYGVTVDKDTYKEALLYGYEHTGKPNGVESLEKFEEMNSSSLTQGLLTMGVLEVLAEKIPH